MKRIVLAATIALGLLSGCANIQPPIPAGYSGPTATLRDTTKYHRSSTVVDMFYLEEIDGREVESTLRRTKGINYGRGFDMRVSIVSRDVPARPVKLKITGQTIHSAPILALTRDVYRVQGTVDFTPEPNKVYLVRGELGENYSAVWIEDEATRTPATSKIEIKGSAKLGVLEK